MKSKNQPRKQSSILSRYTTLPVLMDIIERKCVTLLPPDFWEDRNDREVMLEYKERRSLTCLLAVCFSQGDETIHHWNAFAKGAAGCRIDLHLPTVISSVANRKGFRHGKVSYKKIHKLTDSDLSDKKIPFIKRWPYRIEEEYRIIYESGRSDDCGRKELNVQIPLDCIRSITFSQDMPESVFKSIKTQLGSRIAKRISLSTLFENKVWINKFKGE